MRIFSKQLIYGRQAEIMRVIGVREISINIASIYRPSISKLLRKIGVYIIKIAPIIKYFRISVIIKFNSPIYSSIKSLAYLLSDANSCIAMSVQIHSGLIV